jgi:hypothetical protein
MQHLDYTRLLAVKVSYYGGWGRYRKRTPDPWTEEQARAAHDQRKPYTVLISSVERPRCFVEIGGDVCFVEFLDEYLRNYLSYSFMESKPGLMFMQRFTRRFYGGISDRTTHALSISMNRDGTTKGKRVFYDPPPGRTESGDGTADVSICYSPRPAFGHYEEITREDRELPAAA